MPTIDYTEYDEDDISKIMLGDIVFWKDPDGKSTGNYEVMWMSDSQARQSKSTKVKLWSDLHGEINVTVGSITSRRA